MLTAAALTLLTLVPAAGAAGPSAARTERVRIETDFSFTTNLVHWVDNLAGTSAGKTMPFYRRYWEERFGPMDAGDRSALGEFARIRRLPVPTPGHAIVNESGCLPVEGDGLGWSQIFLVEAMKARSTADLRRGLATHVGEADAGRLVGSLERFRPRFERIWKDLAYVKKFDIRFRRYLDEGDLPGYLTSLAWFFGVTVPADRPMKISFIGLPSDGPTHAEADGDHLLMEIRPGDAPRDQVQVVAHEASHFLMRMMSVEQIDRLARQSFGEGEAGALFWRYMWEGLPTALGQGVAEARLSPATFSLEEPWYHRDVIDRFAKLIYPPVAQSIGASRRLDDGLVPRLTRAVRDSSLLRDGRAAEFLMTAFYAIGDGMDDGMNRLRRRLGLTGDAASPVFHLDEPMGQDLLKRYTCLGGVTLLGPAELSLAAIMDGTPLLSEEVVRQVLEQAARGHGVIVTGRRNGGGPVFFLVSPRQSLIGPLIDAFARLRGLPDRPLIVTGDR